MGKELHYESALGLIFLYVEYFHIFHQSHQVFWSFSAYLWGEIVCSVQMFYGVLTRFSGNFKRATKLAYR